MSTECPVPSKHYAETHEPHCIGLAGHAGPHTYVSKLDHPWSETIVDAQRVIKEGHLVLQKYTCVGCGTRLTMPDTNRFYTTGSCDECDAITDITIRGFNYLVIMQKPDAKTWSRIIAIASGEES